MITGHEFGYAADSEVDQSDFHMKVNGSNSKVHLNKIPKSIRDFED